MASMMAVPTAVSSATFKPHAQCCRPFKASRASVVTRAQQQAAEPCTRRNALGAGLVAVAATVGLLVADAPPASAFLGIGEGKERDEIYASDTASILTEVKSAMTLDKDDPDRDEKIKAIRVDINSWVAKYRRDPKYSGKPSFGNTYSALNTLAGHYNSFGSQAPLPKKRLERLTKELGDAELLLSRNR